MYNETLMVPNRFDSIAKVTESHQTCLHAYLHHIDGWGIHIQHFIESVFCGQPVSPVSSDAMVQSGWVCEANLLNLELDLWSSSINLLNLGLDFRGPVQLVWSGQSIGLNRELQIACIYPELSPSCVDECTSLLLRHKGVGGPRGAKSELAGTNQQRREMQNNVYIMYHIHTINGLQAILLDAIPCCWDARSQEGHGVKMVKSS